MRSIVSLLLILFLVSCEEGKKFEDTYNQALLLQYLVTPNNPQESCESIITNKDLCFQSYYQATGGSFTATSASVKTQTCQGLITSALYSNMSSIAQTCSFNCQASDWKIKTDLGTCRESTPTALVEASINNPSVVSCLRSCFATTNNQISNEQIPSYLFFNIIQEGE